MRRLTFYFERSLGEIRKVHALSRYGVIELAVSKGLNKPVKIYSGDQTKRITDEDSHYEKHVSKSKQKKDKRFSRGHHELTNDGVNLLSLPLSDLVERCIDINRNNKRNKFNERLVLEYDNPNVVSIKARKRNAYLYKTRDLDYKEAGEGNVLVSRYLASKRPENDLICQTKLNRILLEMDTLTFMIEDFTEHITGGDTLAEKDLLFKFSNGYIWDMLLFSLLNVNPAIAATVRRLQSIDFNSDKEDANVAFSPTPAERILNIHVPSAIKKPLPLSPTLKELSEQSAMHRNRYRETLDSGWYNAKISVSVDGEKESIEELTVPEFLLDTCKKAYCHVPKYDTPYGEISGRSLEEFANIYLYQWFIQTQFISKTTKKDKYRQDLVKKMFPDIEKLAMPVSTRERADFVNVVVGWLLNGNSKTRAKAIHQQGRVLAMVSLLEKNLTAAKFMSKLVKKLQRSAVSNKKQICIGHEEYSDFDGKRVKIPALWKSKRNHVSKKFEFVKTEETEALQEAIRTVLSMRGKTMSVYFQEDDVTKTLLDNRPPLMVFVSSSEFIDEDSCNLFGKHAELDLSLRRVMGHGKAKEDYSDDPSVPEKLRPLAIRHQLNKTGYFVDEKGSRPVVYICTAQNAEDPPKILGEYYRVQSGLTLYRSLHRFLKFIAKEESPVWFDFPGYFEVVDSYPNVPFLMEHFDAYVAAQGCRDKPMAFLFPFANRHDFTKMPYIELCGASEISVRSCGPLPRKPTKFIDVNIAPFNLVGNTVEDGQGVHQSGIRYVYAMVYRQYIEVNHGIQAARDVLANTVPNGVIDSDELFARIKSIVEGVTLNSMGFGHRSVRSRMVDAMVDFFYLRYAEDESCQEIIEKLKLKVEKSCQNENISISEYCRYMDIRPNSNTVPPMFIDALGAFLYSVLRKSVEYNLFDVSMRAGRYNLGVDLAEELSKNSEENKTTKVKSK